MRRAERFGAVIADAVLARVPAGQDRAMGGQSERHLGKGVFKKDPACGQGVERRGGGGLVAVASEAIGAGGVQRNQQQILAGELAADCGGVRRVL